EDLLRHRGRPRISAACADAAVDFAAVPDRRGAGADRNADPLRDPRPAVAAFAETAEARGGALFGAADQPQVRAPETRRRIRARLGAAGGRGEHLGDRTDRA